MIYLTTYLDRSLCFLIINLSAGVESLESFDVVVLIVVFLCLVTGLNILSRASTYLNRNLIVVRTHPGSESLPRL